MTDVVFPNGALFGINSDTQFHQPVVSLEIRGPRGGLNAFYFFTPSKADEIAQALMEAADRVRGDTEQLFGLGFLENLNNEHN